MRLICATILSVLFGVSALRAEITGTVRNSENEPVFGASVALLALPDSTYIDGTISQDDGSFVFATNKTAGKFLLRVQAFGYEPANVETEAGDVQPVDIRLQLAATELSEVVVRGKAPVTTQEGNKFIFIPNNLADDVTSARNLMKFVPLVSWGEDKVGILGKGESKIYLNGKDPHLSTKEISALLRTLDPHNIKRIEIITDPGAVQSAADTGGIINIVYDDPSQGLKGSLYDSTYVYNDSPSTTPTLWLSYQKGKFKTSSSLGYYYQHYYQHTTNTYTYGSQGKTIINDTRNKGFSNSLYGKLNLSYDLNRRNQIGASVSLSTYRRHSKSTVNTLTKEDGKEENSKMVQTQDFHPDKPSLSAMAYYTLTLDDKGSMIDVLAGHSQSASRTKIGNNFSGLDVPQIFLEDFYSFAGKADYTQVFNKDAKLKAGLLVADFHLQKNQTLSGVFDNFKYNNRELHAYAQFDKRWGNLFNTTIGLRMESTRTHIWQLQDNQNNTQKYTDFFPTVAISWVIPSGNQSFSIAYNKYILRFVDELNPYKVWSSDNTYSQGNPDLKPSYSHSVNLKYAFLNKFVFSSYYSYSPQPCTTYTINTPEGLTVTSYTNAGRKHTLWLIFDYNARILNIWQIGANCLASYNNFKTRAEGQYIHTSGWSARLLQSNTLFLSRKHFLSCSLSQCLMTPRNEGTYKEDLSYSISLGLQKSFAFGLDASLSADIPVVGEHTSRTFDMPDYSYSYYTHGHLYSVSLSLSYTFGKKQVSGARDRLNELK